MNSNPTPGTPHSIQFPLMHRKKGVVMGVANNRSIAWAIAQKLSEQGAELAFTYAGDALHKRVTPLAESLGSTLILPCDVSESDSIKTLFQEIERKWGKIDFVIHAIGFSDKEELTGKYYNTTRQNFLKTLDISCYSFTEVCREGAKIMNDGGSFLTLSYFGAAKVMPHYNVMGIAKAALEASVRYLAVDLGERAIRVNAISAGPIKTLAASGIGDFNYILKWNQYNAPLRRNVTQEEVGNSGLYLLSPMSSGVTGEIHYVDCGYNVIGMKSIDAPDMTLNKTDGE